MNKRRLPSARLVSQSAREEAARLLTPDQVIVVIGKVVAWPFVWLFLQYLCLETHQIQKGKHLVSVRAADLRAETTGQSFPGWLE
jgi:hypothetical protein